MTEFNNNKFIPRTPKTYEVRYVEVKEPSKLSKLASYLGMKTVENCSYSGCSYKNVPFDVSISIEGQSRNWANTSWNAFPGYWEHKSHILGSYSWRENLYLNQIDQAWDAISFMNNNNLYVVNAAGLFCVENGKFCNNAKDILNKCISHHERGGEVNESEIISSDLHKYAKWTVKTAAIAASTAINPIGTAVVGGTLWVGGKAMEHHRDANEYDKGIFRSISSFGGDMAKSGALGWVGGKADKVADGFKNFSGNQKDFCGWGEATDKAVSEVSKKNFRFSVDFTKDVGSSGMEAVARHEYHQANGRYYDSNCPICK